MLSRAHGEDRSVKTVTLARGSYATATSPTTPSRPRTRTRYSSERNSLSHAESGSPDLSESHASSLLGDIGIEELLAQDPRPSMVVDLADTRNFHSDGLHIIYVNPAFQQKSQQKSKSNNIQNESLDQSVELFSCFENVSAIKAWVYGRGNAESGAPMYTPVLEDGGVYW